MYQPNSNEVEKLDVVASLHINLDRLMRFLFFWFLQACLVFFIRVSRKEKTEFAKSFVTRENAVEILKKEALSKHTGLLMAICVLNMMKYHKKTENDLVDF